MAEEESFKVIDRRGRPSEASTPEPATPTSAAAPGPSVIGAPSQPARPVEAPANGPDLPGVFVMFASSALVNLGEAPDPVTGQARVDLDQAREAIDILLLLRAKTEGNRTEQESHLLEEVLYDLQLRYVRAMGHPERG